MTITFVDIIDIERAGRTAKPDPDFQLPEIRDREYILDDYDESICRIIQKDELVLTHVDENIHSIEPIKNDPWELTTDYADRQDLKITYTDGRKLKVKLGDISKAAGNITNNFIKKDGISFPIDRKGRLLMNGSNTPVLSNIRRSFHEQLHTISKNRLEVMEVGAAFAQIIGTNSTAF